MGVLGRGDTGLDRLGPARLLEGDPPAHRAQLEHHVVEVGTTSPGARAGAVPLEEGRHEGPGIDPAGAGPPPEVGGELAQVQGGVTGRDPVDVEQAQPFVVDQNVVALEVTVQQVALLLV